MNLSYRKHISASPQLQARQKILGNLFEMDLKRVVGKVGVRFNIFYSNDTVNTDKNSNNLESDYCTSLVFNSSIV